MKIDFQSGFNAMLQFCNHYTKQIVGVVEGLPIIGSLIKDMIFGSGPDNKNIHNRKTTPVDKKISDFPTETVSENKYPNLKTGSIVTYKGAFGFDSLEHHGVYLGEGRVMQFTGGAEPDSLTGSVEVTLLSEFEKQTKNDIKVYNSEELQDQNEEDILVRAAEELNKSAEDQIYNPEVNNCQHLANRVSTGDNISSQAVELSKLVDNKTAGFVGKHATQLMIDKGVKSRKFAEVGGEILGLLAGCSVTSVISFLSEKFSTALYNRSCTPTDQRAIANIKAALCNRSSTLTATIEE